MNLVHAGAFRTALCIATLLAWIKPIAGKPSSGTGGSGTPPHASSVCFPNVAG